MFSLKIILTIFMLLILGIGIVGGIYFYNNSKTNPPYDLMQNEPVTTAPVSLALEINSPEEHSLSFDPNIIISGRTLPNIQILISSQSKDLVVLSKTDGSFSTLMDLADGVNNLSITAFAKNGEEKKVDRTIYYSKEKLK